MKPDFLPTDWYARRGQVIICLRGGGAYGCSKTRPARSCTYVRRTVTNSSTALGGKCAAGAAESPAAGGKTGEGRERPEDRVPAQGIDSAVKREPSAVGRDSAASEPTYAAIAETYATSICSLRVPIALPERVGQGPPRDECPQEAASILGRTLELQNSTLGLLRRTLAKSLPRASLTRRPWRVCPGSPKPLLLAPLFS